MAFIQRLDFDVDLEEEMELQRLETGTAHPVAEKDTGNDLDAQLCDFDVDAFAAAAASADRAIDEPDPPPPTEDAPATPKAVMAPCPVPARGSSPESNTGAGKGKKVHYLEHTCTETLSGIPLAWRAVTELALQQRLEQGKCRLSRSQL